jgi:hypothetical protein
LDLFISLKPIQLKVLSNMVYLVLSYKIEEKNFLRVPNICHMSDPTPPSLNIFNILWWHLNAVWFKILTWYFLAKLKTRIFSEGDGFSNEFAVNAFSRQETALFDLKKNNWIQRKPHNVITVNVIIRFIWSNCPSPNLLIPYVMLVSMHLLIVIIRLMLSV